MLARMNKVVGFKFEGKRIDTGNAMGLLHASMYQAYHRPETRARLMELIQEFQTDAQKPTTPSTKTSKK